MGFFLAKNSANENFILPQWIYFKLPVAWLGRRWIQDEHTPPEKDENCIVRVSKKIIVLWCNCVKEVNCIVRQLYQRTLENAARSVWLAPWSCLSSPDKIGLISTGRTREDTGDSWTRPVISLSLCKNHKVGCNHRDGVHCQKNIATKLRNFKKSAAAVNHIREQQLQVLPDRTLQNDKNQGIPNVALRSNFTGPPSLPHSPLIQSS